MKVKSKILEISKIENKDLNNKFNNYEREILPRIILTNLTEEQKNKIVNPEKIFPDEKVLLAIHWHPEFVPIPLIRERIKKMYPNIEKSLIIPTQHNVIMEYDEYAGVEVDCFSPEFNRKVQLLIHLKSERLKEAGVFLGMLEHTNKYRKKQLFELIDTILEPSMEKKFKKVVEELDPDENIIEFVKDNTRTFKKMLNEYESVLPSEGINNKKLLRYYFEALRDHYDEHVINHAKILVKTANRVVKENFDYGYFYRTEEIIEEARSLGAGIIIPHPEQFWPILLANYNVDGYEVWNPNSREYTEFLINVINNQNRLVSNSKRLLLFMGDDSHLGEKIKPTEIMNSKKAEREIGVQPPWHDTDINKSLIIGNFDKGKIIEEYSARLE